MTRLSLVFALLAVVGLATAAADPGVEVPVELNFAGFVKRQTGKFQPPEVPAGATNPTINPDDANLFDDTQAVQGTGVNKIAPFAGGNKERKRAIWQALDPAARKRAGLDVNLVSHDKATRGLKGGVIQVI